MSPRTEPSAQGSVTPDPPDLIVEPQWLAARLGATGLRVVDLRDADAHVSGHIPGAARVELSALGSRLGGMDNVLLPEREFAGLMARLGISNGDVVVTYDDQWGLAAARLVWALHYYGHDGVAVLDGGWDRWEAEGHPRAEGEERVAPGRFESKPRRDVLAERDWIVRRIEAGDAVLLDTRTRSEYDAGHLPGAKWWDWFNGVPPGSWNVSRDPDELRAEWKALGLNVSDDVIVYCRSGMRAAHTYVVLRNAGFERVRLYDGSWQEWSMRQEVQSGD